MDNLNNNYFCGAIPSPKDDRDYQFAALGGATATVQPYQSIVPIKVWDQGASSQCGGCAGSMWKREREYYQNNDPSLFSHTYIYGMDTDYSGEGMYGRTLARILKDGVPHIHGWETWGTKSQAREVVNAKKSDLLDEINTYRGNSYYYCNSWVEILNAIRTCNGCIVMVPVYYNWYTVNHTGIVGRNSGTFYGYHFIFCKDYVQKENGSYRIRFVNSWGKYWGDYGCGYIDTDINVFTEAFAIVDDVNEVKKMMNFTDLNKNHWAYDVIEKAYDKGVVNGFEDNTFRPDEQITRAQMCKILDNLGLLD